MNTPFIYVSPTLSVEILKHSIACKLMFTIDKDPVIANKHEWLNTTLFAVRNRLMKRWLHSNHTQLSQETRQVCYLSMELPIGRTLSNTLLSLDIYGDVKDALGNIGLDLGNLIDKENDPGPGNGGLGRLATCFLDSLAALGLSGHGYGIRYDYGTFKQNIVDGCQKGSPDYWLKYGNLWESKRRNTRYKVRFDGRIQQEGKKTRWIETEETPAVVYDQIVPGYDTDAANMLRLWNAQVNSEINLGKFNRGNYSAMAEGKNHSENISRVSYLDNSIYSGRELRLRQKYFLVSSTVQDILSRHYQLHKAYDNLADKIATHLNDIRPVLSIPELMRLLIDEHKFGWDDAFEIYYQVFSCTNHTLMSEALETWPVDILDKILPHHLQIIFEINGYFLKTLQEQYPNDISLLGKTPIIDESDGRRVHMAWLAMVVSHKINGVSELYSNLMMQPLFVGFAKIFPTRFYSVTSGMTPHRWLALANPSFSEVLDENIGRTWRTGLSQLSELEQHCDYPLVNQAVRRTRLENKKRPSTLVAQQLSIVANPKSLFGVQIKRIYEYKRQLMSTLHVTTRYNHIKADPNVEWVPRMNVFAGKATSTYYMAKHIAHLISDVARVINNDPQIGDELKVVFIPNYNVSPMQVTIPAIDLSEQVSLAGTKTPGASSMEFALNSALTIGTLDGANVEMLEHVGTENIFIFDNTAKEVEALRSQGYKPREYYEKDEELHQVLTQVDSGAFSPEEPGRYRDLMNSLIDFGDHYQVLADYRSYVDCQDEIDKLYRHPEEWTTESMINITSMGYFSLDRTIKEYAESIRHTDSVRLQHTMPGTLRLPGLRLCTSVGRIRR